MREERRRSLRVPVFLEVRAKHSDLSVIYPKSLDLSVGGICILSPKELPGGRVTLSDRIKSVLKVWNLASLEHGIEWIQTLEV